MYNFNPLYDKIEELNKLIDTYMISSESVDTNRLEDLEYQLQKLFYRLEDLRSKKNMRD